MERSVLMGGFGGQGVQTCGKLLIYTTTEEEKIATFFSQYGGAMRGGTSNCTVITSDEEIGDTNKTLVDYVCAFNVPSFKKFESRVAPGGTMIANSTVIDKSMATRDDIHYVYFPATQIAEELGSLKALNVVMFGFYCAYSDMVGIDTARSVVEQRMGKKPAFLELNKKAFDTGVAEAKKAKAEMED